MAETVVLKLGGSIITKKAQGKLEVDEVNLTRLAGEIAEALLQSDIKLVIIHGAGPFGHVLAEKYKLTEGLLGSEQIEGMAATHASMEKLNAAVVGALIESGVTAISFQPSAGGILDNQKLVEFPVGVLREMLDAGFMPVGYGDVLIDRATGINILSGDHLVPYLARKLPANRVVIATDVDGIFTGDPKDGGNQKKIDVITKENIGSVKLSGSKATDVTGGMERKVRELLLLAESGISSHIISGLSAGELTKVLKGSSSAGTVIT